MIDAVIVLVSLLMFSLCCRQLMKTVLKPIPVMASQRQFARPALQLEKAYKAFSWGAMTCVFLALLVISFYHVFTTL